MGIFNENEDAENATEETTTAEVETPKAEKPKAPKKAVKATEPEAEAEAEAEEEEAVPEKKPEAKAKTGTLVARYAEGSKPSKDLIKSDQDMRDYLMSFPKVRVMIPLAPGEKPGSTEPIIVNGVRLNVLKGSMVDLPSPFADQIFNHYNIGQLEGALGAGNRIDGNAAKEHALN